MDPLRSFAIILLLANFSGCGSHLGFRLASPRSQAPAGGVKDLSGQFETTDHVSVDLAESRDRPVVLIFSQDTCTACSVETDLLRASLTHGDADPGRVHVFTVLVGSILADAVDWKKEHRVPWSVGFDEKGDLFRQYCATPTVPCSIVYVPGRGVVLTKNGSAAFHEYTDLTGPWEESEE